MEDIARYIDHTILKPEAGEETIRRYCAEARRYGFCSVCVNSCHTALVHRELAGSGVKTCTVVGFPLGAMSEAAKAFETRQAVADGADEIDMVINIGALKDGDDERVLSDIRAVVEAAKPSIVKVIIETCLLSEEEKIRACNELSRAACRKPLGPEEFEERLRGIEELRGYIPWQMCLVYMLTSASMTLFFGGSLHDAMASAIAGVALYLSGRLMDFARIQNFVTAYIEAFMVGMSICLLIKLGLGDNYDLISMGNIMLMISGSGLMTSVRDMINNDILSGMMGLLSAVIGAAAIALGFVSAALLFM